MIMEMRFNVSRYYVIKINKYLIISSLIILFVLFAYLFSVNPVHISIIIIAASNSNSHWKSEATAICNGTSDQNIINKYLAVGKTVKLAPGTFNINGNILPASSTHFYGQGNTTIINLQCSMIYISNKNNVEVDHFKITGTSSGVGAIFIGSAGAAVSGFKIHDIQAYAVQGDQTTFQVYSNIYTVSDVVFSRVDAFNPPGFGFLMAGEGPGNNIQNVTFYKDTVENAGVYNNSNIWATGFNFAETTGTTVSHVQVINCSVNGAWESGYHFEDAPTKIDIILTGNIASNAGQKSSPAFGWGYVSDYGDVIFANNFSGGGNKNGDLRTDVGVDTPPVTRVVPYNSGKIATAINQSNCSGVIINTDASHKELVLYSNDGNAVNQQIELGAAYLGNDGNIYSFSGTKIIAQFADYAVIKLVKSY